MTINWRQGFRRLSSAFVVTVWVATMMVQAADLVHGRFTAESFGYAIGGLLVFTLVWGVLAAAVAWIARGFTEPTR